jgi:ABC-2 type transport system permease protein
MLRAIIPCINVALKVLAVMQASWKQQLSYKANVVITFFSGAIPLIGIYYLWIAIYSENYSEIYQIYSLSKILTYAFSAFILNAIITPFGIEWEISSNVLQGDLTRYILYPFSYIKYCCCWLTSEKLLNLLLHLPFIFLIFFILRDHIIFPPIEFAVLLVISIIFAYIIYFFISFSIGLSSFWWTDVTGLFYVGNTIVGLCSGLLLPLNVFPPNIEIIMKFLPFQYIIYFPIQIFIQSIDISEIFINLGIQVVWIVGGYIGVKALLSLGLKKYEGYGG